MTSFPYLAIAKQLSVSYARVLAALDDLERDPHNPGYWLSGAPDDLEWNVRNQVYSAWTHERARRREVTKQ